MTRMMNRNHLRAKATHAKHMAVHAPVEPRRPAVVYRYPTGELCAFDQFGNRMKAYTVDALNYDGPIVDITYGAA